MLRVALTGGIASGKSATATVFRELGVPVIDTDRIARDVVEPGMPGLDALREEFGSEILDRNGRLDRKRLRQRIFSDETARRRVNALLHPLILHSVEAELAELAAPYAVIEIPLLAETGLEGIFDRVVVVDADDEVRMQRLQQRDGVTESEARSALEAQAARDERLRLATDVIDNSGNIAALTDAVRALDARFRAAAKPFASQADQPSE